MTPKTIHIIGNFPCYTPIPDGKGSWLSNDKLVIDSERIGRFTIPAGSHNNLASIPKPARSFFSVNGPHRIAAVVHDYLYEMDGELPERTISRKEADAVFFDAMRMSRNEFYRSLSDVAKLHLVRNGLEGAFLTHDPLVGWFTSHTMHAAVRAGGWYPWGD